MNSIVSYDHADNQKKKIDKFIAEPKSDVGIVTLPTVVTGNETITIPAGRQAVVSEMTVDAGSTLTVETGAVLGVIGGGQLSKVKMVTDSIESMDGLTVLQVADIATQAYVSSARKDNAGVGFDFYGDEASLLANKGNKAIACNNQILVIADYQELYDNIGTTFDTFNGAVAPSATEFRAPPQEVGGLGLYNRGVGATNGGVGTYQADVFKSHTHQTNMDTAPSGTLGASVAGGRLANKDYYMSFTGDVTETRPRSLTVLKCVWTGK